MVNVSGTPNRLKDYFSFLDYIEKPKIQTKNRTKKSLSEKTLSNLYSVAFKLLKKYYLSIYSIQRCIVQMNIKSGKWNQYEFRGSETVL